jgi:hypothetical protein
MILAKRREARSPRSMRFPIKITENFLLEPMLRTFGTTRETSYLAIEGGALEVSMGRWFHERIALDQIASLAPSDWPWWGGLGVKVGHHGVGVVGSSENIVNIKLKTTQKVHVVVVVEVEQLWVSVEDRDGFLAALAEATKLPVSPHTPF